MQTLFKIRGLFPKIPKKCGYILVIIMMLAGQIQLFATDKLSEVAPMQQQITISGVIVDEQGETLPGVSIVVKGTLNGQASNVDGRFTITVPGANSVLVFSYLGYITKEVTVGNNRNLNITLIEDTQQLEEVVVVGYGTQKKATITGSVVAINNEQLTLTKNNNTQNMLTGKLPGLRVIQNTSEPGTFSNKFDIRGFGDPLFVVDGVPRGDFPRMDANDIESISILKDAAAAVYGVRAANGVVLITTKSGEKQKASIEYSGYYGLQTPAEILHPINSLNRTLLVNETTMRSTSNPTKTFSNQYIQDIIDGKIPNTDWYGLIMRDAAPQQQHNISVRGGTDAVDYFVNLGYNNQGSFWKTNSTDYQRYNVRTNLNVKIIDNLRFSVKLNYITDQTKRQRTSATSIFAVLWRSKPTDPIYANNTEPYLFHPTSGDIMNVVALVEPSLVGEIDNKKNILQSNFSLNYQMPFIKGLSANFMFSYDKASDDNSNFQKTFNEYVYNEAGGNYITYSRNSPNQLTREYRTSYSNLWNVQLNYDNMFADLHRISALLLYEEGYGQNYNFQARRDFSIPIPYLFAGDTGNQYAYGSGLAENANRAFVGRLNYDFSGKYLFEFAFRYDGSSKFPKGAQWGFFPSFQLGYRMSEEAFIKNNFSFVDNLKLRSSYGVLGDDSTSSSQFIEGFDYPATGGREPNPVGFIFGNTFVTGLGFRNAPNLNLTWAESQMKNIGLDLDMWRGLLGVSVDVFQRDRKGLMAAPDVSVPGTFGSGISDVNINGDRNKGFEVELRHRKNISRDLNYYVTGFVSMTRIMRRFWLQDARNNSYDYWRNNTVNRYNDVWFAYGAAGTYKNWDDIIYSMYSSSGSLPGDPIYEDWNGDGVISAEDRYPLATTISPGSSFQDRRNYPLMNFALTLGGRYKWFDLNLHFQGSALAYVSYGEQLIEPLAWDGNALEILFDRWHPVNPDVDPYNPTIEWITGRYPYGKTRADINSDFNIQNGAYLRLKNAELGFTVPKNIVTSKLKVNNLRIYVNAYNLLTLTKVIGLDPEKPTENYGYMYPLNRTFNFGGSIKF